MIRALIDQIMTFNTTPVLLVLAHVGALIWAIRPRGGILPVLALNLVIATGILGYNIQHFAQLFAHADATLLALVAFALVNLLVSAAALTRRIPSAFVWVLFAVDFVLSMLLLAFMLTFKIDRLI
jgi:hypothetical protein